MKRLNRFTRFVAGFSLIFLSIVIVVGMWKVGGVAAFFFAYNWALSRMIAIDNPQIREVASVFVALLIYFGIYRGLYRRNRNWGIIAFSLLLIMQSTMAFFADRNDLVSKYYSRNPVTGEIMLSDSSGTDAFGTAKKGVDSTVAKEIYLQKGHEGNSNSEIPFNKLKVFFNQKTGEALVYCYRDVSNKTHFFLHDGCDPFTGRNLTPVTPEVVEEQMGVVRNSLPAKPSPVRTSVVVVVKEVVPPKVPVPKIAIVANKAPAKPQMVARATPVPKKQSSRVARTRKKRRYYNYGYEHYQSYTPPPEYSDYNDSSYSKPRPAKAIYDFAMARPAKSSSSYTAPTQVRQSEKTTSTSTTTTGSSPVIGGVESDSRNTFRYQNTGRETSNSHYTPTVSRETSDSGWVRY